MSKRKKSPQMVAVRWVDASMSCAPHWSDTPMPERPSKKSHNVCTTVGFLIYMDDEWCQLVATLTDGQHAHVTEIPRGMVEAVTVLKPVES